MRALSHVLYSPYWGVVSQRKCCDDSEIPVCNAPAQRRKWHAAKKSDTLVESATEIRRAETADVRLCFLLVACRSCLCQASHASRAAWVACLASRVRKRGRRSRQPLPYSPVLLKQRLGQEGQQVVLGRAGLVVLVVRVVLASVNGNLTDRLHLAAANTRQAAAGLLCKRLEPRHGAASCLYVKASAPL
eukprot:47747-Chlamydomonas_euryale.AAC.4